MKISDKGIKLIKSFEGLQLESYFDSVNVLTIGYGSTGEHVYLGQTITEAEAEDLLKKDIERFEIGVTGLVKVPVTPNQFDALVSFAFNLGLRSLAGSTLLKKLNAKDYPGAAYEFLRWDKAGGMTLRGLTRRREAEKALFLHE